MSFDDDFGNFNDLFGVIGDEQSRQFNTEIDVKRQGIRSNEKISAAANAARLKEAAMRIAEDKRQFDLSFGLEEKKFGEGTRRFDLEFGLSRDKFGADILKTGAEMRGPLNYYQGNMFARGLQDRGLAPYLESLRSGAPPRYGGGTATTGNPTPLTVQTLANDLMGQAGQSTAGGTAPAPGAPPVAPPAVGQPIGITDPGYLAPTSRFGQPIPPAAPVAGAPAAHSAPTAAGQLVAASSAPTDAFGRPLLNARDQQSLGVISDVAQRGLANLPLGSLENLSEGELASFRSGLSYLGRNDAEELEFYRRSRPAQGSARSA